VLSLSTTCVDQYVADDDSPDKDKNAAAPVTRNGPLPASLCGIVYLVMYLVVIALRAKPACESNDTGLQW
jgi:hypothetical protein